MNDVAVDADDAVVANCDVAADRASAPAVVGYHAVAAEDDHALDHTADVVLIVDVAAAADFVDVGVAVAVSGDYVAPPAAVVAGCCQNPRRHQPQKICPSLSENEHGHQREFLQHERWNQVQSAE